MANHTSQKSNAVVTRQDLLTLQSTLENKLESVLHAFEERIVGVEKRIDEKCGRIEAHVTHLRHLLIERNVLRVPQKTQYRYVALNWLRTECSDAREWKGVVSVVVSFCRCIVTSIRITRPCQIADTAKNDHYLHIRHVAVFLLGEGDASVPAAQCKLQFADASPFMKRGSAGRTPHKAINGVIAGDDVNCNWYDINATRLARVHEKEDLWMEFTISHPLNLNVYLDEVQKIEIYNRKSYEARFVGCTVELLGGNQTFFKWVAKEAKEIYVIPNVDEFCV